MNVICVYVERPRIGERILVAVLEQPDGVDAKTVVRNWRGSMGLTPDGDTDYTSAPVIPWNSLKDVFRPFKQTLAESEYTLVRRINADEVILREEGGNDELWARNPGHASYGVVIDGEDYEFVSSVTAAEIMALL